MKIKSINPYTGKKTGSHKLHNQKEITRILNRSKKAYDKWKNEPLAERAKLMARAGETLRKNLETYSQTITEEMGKPITESKAEIEKCAWVCDYYADNAADFLADEPISTDAKNSFVRHHPIGTVFAVMPWNFPFWQVFRFAAPTLTAGNTGILKHASNVGGCAKQIESVFEEAGFPKGVFQNLIIGHEHTEIVISHPAIKAVTLTGSEGAGKAVAKLAGKHLKKSLLELGGSNAFMVLDDADLESTIKTAVNARMMNTGQSCIAAKRFIVTEKIYDAFLEKFIRAVRELKSGDPMEANTQIGVLAREDLAEELNKQIDTSVKKGAKIALGGHRRKAYHEPTVLTGVKPGMPAFDEETFGPVAAVIKAKDADEAYALSQKSNFALGVTVCTSDVNAALDRSREIEDGAYFINELVKSDPRLPFGGQRNSGYGRELGKDGIMEFVNRQTVYVK
ncbi:MAG: NAD-dependent succinate-semialdehyde dehydrogenase [Cryomorphaceae bacterium]